MPDTSGEPVLPGRKTVREHIQNFACVSVTCVPSAGTYLDMRRRMRLVDKPKASALWWNYLFSKTLNYPSDVYEKTKGP